MERTAEERTAEYELNVLYREAMDALRCVNDSLQIRSFQRNGISYGGDRWVWVVSQDAVDALRAALAGVVFGSSEQEEQA